MLTLEAGIYLLCIATSGLCAWLLIAAFRVNRQGLLLWSALCFVLLTVNNVLVFADIILLPQIDLSTPRSLTALAAGILLLCGFIWELE